MSSEVFDSARRTLPEPGEVVGGRFVLREVVGQGAFGTVWRASDQRFPGVDRAVKVLTRVGDGSDDAQRRFRAEIEILARLESPHVVRVYDHGQVGPYPFLAMELLDGEDLHRHLAPEDVADGLPWRWVVELLAQACLALEEAHAKGLVHRDLKPSNLFLQRIQGADRPVLKVIDFGVAKVPDADPAHATQGLIGTPAYMAPEQILGEVGPATDMYALGVVAYQFLTGRLPFRGGIREVLEDHRWKAPPAIQLPSDAPPALPKLVGALLAKEPADRPTAAELRRALEAIPEASRLGSVSTDAPAPSSRSRAPWVLVLSALGVGAAAWALLRAPTSPPVSPANPEPTPRSLLRGAVERSEARIEVEGPSAVRIGETLELLVRSPIRGRLFVVLVDTMDELFCLDSQSGEPLEVEAGAWIPLPALEAMAPAGVEDLYFFVVSDGERLVDVVGRRAAAACEGAEGVGASTVRSSSPATVGTAHVRISVLPRPTP